MNGDNDFWDVASAGGLSQQVGKFANGSPGKVPMVFVDKPSGVGTISCVIVSVGVRLSARRVVRHRCRGNESSGNGNPFSLGVRVNML